MAKSSAINISSGSSSLVTDSSGTLVASSPMTDGQVIIGSTGATPVAASLVAGSGISITPGAGAITIAATGGSGGALVNVQYLTTSGTYTATAGTVSCIVMAVAGGGGGGGTPDNSVGFTASCSGSGGSGGAFGQKYYAIAPTGTAYVVGAGGAGGAAGGSTGGISGPNAGSSGGATTFNNGDMNLLGGGGGGYQNWIRNDATPAVTVFGYSNPGGEPDVTDNSDISCNGCTGGLGRNTYANATFLAHSGPGYGGDSVLGKGATAPFITTLAGNANGRSATGPGGGGAGGFGYRTAAALQGPNSGGNGAPGIIIVYEYA